MIAPGADHIDGDGPNRSGGTNAIINNRVKNNLKELPALFRPGIIMVKRHAGIRKISQAADRATPSAGTRPIVKISIA
jgi:hypothetical protein